MEAYVVMRETRKCKYGQIIHLIQITCELELEFKNWKIS